jgi:hypothetical protein
MHQSFSAFKQRVSTGHRWRIQLQPAAAEGASSISSLR